MTEGAAPQPRFFFIHVMKTAGTTFVLHLQRHFPPEQLYPCQGLDWTSRSDVGVYSSVPRLLALPEHRKSAIRVYSGHYPFVVHESLGDDFVTLTLLRDPVDRTVSMLKHLKRVDRRIRPEHADDPIEAIYDDELMYRVFIENFQAKTFAIGRDDDLPRAFPLAETVVYWEALERGEAVEPPDLARAIRVDNRRLEVALTNLARVDVVGLTENYDGFVTELRARCGWWTDVRPTARANVNAEQWDAPASLRRRIAADNA